MTRTSGSRFTLETVDEGLFRTNKGNGEAGHYNPHPVDQTNLYFAYTALLDPDRMSAVAPGAKFLFTAHYPETSLVFVGNGAGPLPTLVESPGSTVWGGVFEVPEDQIQALVEAEAEEGRSPDWEHRAVDRAGNKHECLAFVIPGEGEAHEPPVEYVETMIRGARHWNLPAGWVVGLEDLVEDPLFS